jgi:hypothetical protein
MREMSAGGGAAAPRLVPLSPPPDLQSDAEFNTPMQRFSAFMQYMHRILSLMSTT